LYCNKKKIVFNQGDGKSDKCRYSFRQQQATDVNTDHCKEKKHHKGVVLFEAGYGNRLSHCGARSGAALTVHRTVIHSRAASIPYSISKRKSTTKVLSDCRKTVFRNQARHGFLSVLLNIWNKLNKKT